jgi:hypothetical protein
MTTVVNKSIKQIKAGLAKHGWTPTDTLHHPFHGKSTATVFTCEVVLNKLVIKNKQKSFVPDKQLSMLILYPDGSYDKSEGTETAVAPRTGWFSPKQLADAYIKYCDALPVGERARQIPPEYQPLVQPLVDALRGNKSTKTVPAKDIKVPEVLFKVGDKVTYKGAGKVARLEGTHGKLCVATVTMVDETEKTLVALPQHRIKSKNFQSLHVLLDFNQATKA